MMLIISNSHLYQNNSHNLKNGKESKLKFGSFIFLLYLLLEKLEHILNEA